MLHLGQVDCTDDGSNLQQVNTTAKDLCITIAAVTYATSATRLPIAVITPGFTLSQAEYLTWAEHLSTFGYFVVRWTPTEGAFSHTTHDTRENMAMLFVDWAVQFAKQHNILVDPKRVFHVGHSLGGKCAVKAAEMDPRGTLVQ
jgi:predicted dienelactone hydrolase